MNDSGTALAPKSVSDTMQGTTSEFSQELAPTAGAEAARQEVQAAVVLAKRFPRNEDEAYAKIIKACKRPTFASDVEYAFPRAGKTITGPAIYLAREFARVWGNIRHGCDIIADAEEERTIRAWAWDLETNVKVTSDATFKKLIYRQKGGWQKPDERDLRELTNRHAALAKRNCLLELLPSDMVEDACKQARATMRDAAAADPDATRKTIITSFAELNVPIGGLEKYLGHPLGECSPDELANLRTIYKSIKDGNSTWAEYLNGNGQADAAEMAAKTKEKAEAMKAKMAAKEPTKPPSDTDDVAEAEDDKPDALESLRADVNAALDGLMKDQRVGILSGRKVKDMGPDELNQVLIDVRKIAEN